MERAALYVVFKFAAICAGFFSCGVLSYLYFNVVGHFPVKEYMVVILATIWAVLVSSFCWFKYQRLGLRVDILKAIETWFCLSVYGATSAALLFSEVSVGSSELSTDVAMAGPVYAVISFHLLAGFSAILLRGPRNG